MRTNIFLKFVLDWLFQYFESSQVIQSMKQILKNKKILRKCSCLIAFRIIKMKVKNTIVKSLSYLGAAICEGQQVKGVQNGPQLIRESGVFELLKKQYGVATKDYGDISISTCKEAKLYPIVEHTVRNLNVLGPLLKQLHEKTYQIISSKENQFLLTVGGDHSIGAATISAIQRYHQNLKIVWVDAHPDFTNFQRNIGNKFSQNYHGMPLSHLTGHIRLPPLDYFKWIADRPPINPKNVVLIAIRDIDPDEYAALAKVGIRCYTMDHIDKYGIGQVMTSALEHLDPNKQSPFHLSFDIDACDPDLVGQTGTRFRYGLSGRQSIHIVRRIAHERKMVSMDLVQINSELKISESIRKKYRGEADLKEVSDTVGLGIDLISSVFTKYLTI